MRIALCIPGLLLASGAILATNAIADQAHAAPIVKAKHHLPHTPCAQEDSRSCVWDAVHMGNGQGQSFWTGPAGRTHYISHLRAHTLINGMPNFTDGPR